MNRCPAFAPISLRFASSALLLALCLGAAPAASAQQNFSAATDDAGQPLTLPRNFPDKADKGRILFLDPPTAKLNGEKILISPGARIKDQHNRMITVAQLALTKEEFNVMYTRDAMQQIGDIWLLSDYEAKHAISPKQKRDLQLRYMGIDPTHKIDPLVPFNSCPNSRAKLPRAFTLPPLALPFSCKQRAWRIASA